MSHNIVLKDVKIKDLVQFGSIVSKMSDGKASLVNPATSFRTYRGQPTHCDAKIAMPGPHDVGLRKQADGSYSVVFDPYRMDTVFTHLQGTNKIGALLQEYTLQEAEYAAALKGMSSNRVESPNGTVTLELVQAS